MTDLELQNIYIYPIKSLGGTQVQQAEVQQTGLQYDRRWTLIDNTGRFISQRTNSNLALLQVNITSDCLIITHKKNLLQPLTVPLDTGAKPEISVDIWEDTCSATEVSAIANEWFSSVLKMPVRLVYMPATARRLVDTNYAFNNQIVSFADAYPFLIIGQSSLDDLNCRLDNAVPMNRFRPNFVFKGGAPYFEDTMHAFLMGNVTFYAVKPCARCVLVTINQENAEKSKEPLKTLAAYRTLKNKVMFGQNLLHSGEGIVRVGDKLTVKELKSEKTGIL